MSEAEASLAELVAQEREAMVPSAQIRARNLEGLRAALAEGRAPIVDVPPPATAGSGSTATVVGVAVAGGVALAAILWLGLGSADEPAPEVAGAEAVEAVVDEPPEPSEADAAGSASARDSEVGAGVPTEPEPEPEPHGVEDIAPPGATGGEAVESAPGPAAARRARARGGRSPSDRTRPSSLPEETGGDSAFAEELRLLKKAKAAADAERHESALRMLDRAAQRFGAGFFAEERQALRVRVLCALGRQEAGRAAARAFFRDYPASPQTERVRHACD